MEVVEVDEVVDVVEVYEVRKVGYGEVEEVMSEFNTVNQ